MAIVVQRIGAYLNESIEVGVRFNDANGAVTGVAVRNQSPLTISGVFTHGRTGATFAWTLEPQTTATRTVPAGRLSHIPGTEDTVEVAVRVPA